MNKEIINLENVSKKFIFLNSFEKNFKGILKSFLTKQEFWALREINLRITDGEQIGFIGKNGAGKTLLLKVISGIVFPSLGNVFVKRIVSPIFEYGAGFHPELNGRENIFLYGSLLGIKKREIKNNFENIVSFSELSEFLELRIKYYSAGMRIRLAFSVASILKPEILILDEALSLGDMAFVKKMHDKIEELQRSNVTMLITSHSFEILKRFCTRGCVLRDGKIEYLGDIGSAIEYYEEKIIKKLAYKTS